MRQYGKIRQSQTGQRKNTIRPMRFACWITKAIVTHLEYVLLNAFPRQQWLRERASILRLQVHCLSY